MLQHIPFPVLPAPASWYPGHMTQFTRKLPALLRRTDVVLELRDSRLPLTSINRNFEGAFFVLVRREPAPLWCMARGQHGQRVGGGAVTQAWVLISMGGVSGNLGI